MEIFGKGAMLGKHNYFAGHFSERRSAVDFPWIRAGQGQGIDRRRFFTRNNRWHALCEFKQCYEN